MDSRISGTDFRALCDPLPQARPRCRSAPSPFGEGQKGPEWTLDCKQTLSPRRQKVSGTKARSDGDGVSSSAML